MRVVSPRAHAACQEDARSFVIACSFDWACVRDTASSAAAELVRALANMSVRMSVGVRVGVRLCGAVVGLVPELLVLHMRHLGLHASSRAGVILPTGKHFRQPAKMTPPVRFVSDCI